MKLLTKAIEKQLAMYPIYSQDGKGGKAQVICKFFNPCGSQTWYILEGEKQDDDYILFAAQLIHLRLTQPSESISHSSAQEYTIRLVQS